MTLTSVSHAYSKWLPATCCSVSYSNTRQSFNPGYYSFSGERAIYYQQTLEAHFTISISLTLLPATLDRLAFDTRLPAAIVGQATMSLRLKRLVRFLPGNRVAPEK